MAATAGFATPTNNWLRALRRYMAAVAAGKTRLGVRPYAALHPVGDGNASAIVFAALHCTGGDILIALASVMLALILAGQASWPRSGSRRIVAIAVVLGLSYTLFSGWLNIEIRQSWAYSEIMPVIPLVDASLTPVLQWIVVPACGLLAGVATRGSC